MGLTSMIMVDLAMGPAFLGLASVLFLSARILATSSLSSELPSESKSISASSSSGSSFLAGAAFFSSLAGAPFFSSLPPLLHVLAPGKRERASGANELMCENQRFTWTNLPSTGREIWSKTQTSSWLAEKLQQKQRVNNSLSRTAAPTPRCSCGWRGTCSEPRGPWRKRGP
jgi:hypothetical protein